MMHFSASSVHNELRQESREKYSLAKLMVNSAIPWTIMKSEGDYWLDVGCPPGQAGYIEGRCLLFKTEPEVVMLK